MLVFINV